MIFQILLVLFALFAIAKTFRQYKQSKVSVYWFMVWVLFWALVIAVAFAPQTTDVIASYVGVEKGADLVVYTGMVILFYALYRLLVRSEKQSKEITHLTRKISKMEAKKKRNA